MNLGEAILNNGKEASEALKCDSVLRELVTEDQARTMRRMSRGGWRQTDIADYFGVSKQSVSRALEKK